MTYVAAWPAAAQRASVSPSQAADLLECPLRLAFRTVGGGSWLGTPASRLGSAIHAVLAEAARGALGSPGEEGWRDRFEGAWRRAVEEQEDEVAALGACWPPSVRWPGFATRKALTRRLASSLAKEISEADVIVEQPMTSKDGWLQGRPDVVFRTPKHEVRDFKTGGVHDSAGEVRRSYRLQLELYAVLERDYARMLPDFLVLVPLEGNPVRWPAQEDVIRATEEEARQGLRSYDNCVAAGDVSTLGRPGPDACRWCPWAARCPAFHAAYQDNWWPGVAVARGTVTETRTAARGTTAMSIAATDGTTTRIAGIEPTDHQALAEAVPGDAVSVVGAAARPDGSVAMTRSARSNVQSSRS